jgi:hypothetical protein
MQQRTNIRFCFRMGKQLQKHTKCLKPFMRTKLYFIRVYADGLKDSERGVRTLKAIQVVGDRQLLEIGNIWEILYCSPKIHRENPDSLNIIYKCLDPNGIADSVLLKKHTQLEIQDENQIRFLKASIPLCSVLTNSTCTPSHTTFTDLIKS